MKRFSDSQEQPLPRPVKREPLSIDKALKTLEELPVTKGRIIKRAKRKMAIWLIENFRQFSATSPRNRVYLTPKGAVIKRVSPASRDIVEILPPIPTFDSEVVDSAFLELNEPMALSLHRVLSTVFLLREISSDKQTATQIQR